jgi:hypothetical protein
MAIAIKGTDGNPLTSRDVDALADNFVFVSGQLVFSGSYSTGGDTLDWTTVLAGLIPSSQCLQLAIWSQNGNLLRQYVAIGSVATALNAWKVKISASATFGTELSAGAYASDITGDTICFEAVFRKLQ